MSFYTDLTGGIAALLATSGAGIYNPSAAYTSTDTAIIVGTVPQTPDKVICLHVYTPPDPNPDPYQSDELVGLQVWIRGANGDPRPVQDLADLIHGALHGAENLTFGSAFLLMAWRYNETSMGQDSRGRSEWVCNYRARLNRPTARTQ